MADAATDVPAKKAPESKPAEKAETAKETPSLLSLSPDLTLQQIQKKETAANSDATDKLLAKKDIPKVTLEEGERPKDQNQAQVMNVLQERLMQPGVLAAITPLDKVQPGETQDQYKQREMAKLQERQKELQIELGTDPEHKGPAVWGKESQAAFKDYVSWIQGKVIPGTMSALISAGVPEPPGGPMRIPEGMSPQDFETKVATNQMSMNFGIDANRIPSVEQFKKLEDALNWTNSSSELLQKQHLTLQDKQINTAIDTMGFPKGWHYSGDSGSPDAAAGRGSAADMIDLYSRMKRAIDVIDSNHIHDVDLPAGVKITRGPDGSISNLAIPMPQDLRQEDPKNAEIIQRDREWLEKADAKIQNAMKDKNVPTLGFSDTVIPQVFDKQGNKINAQARLDDKGNLLDVVNPATAPAADTVTKEQVAGRITETASSVNDAMSKLPDAAKQEWKEMTPGKDGQYSSAQLDFVKSNGSPEVFSAAQEHNKAIQSPDGYVKNGHDLNMLKERYSTDAVSKDQVADRAKETKAQVDTAVLQLPQDQKTAFSALKAGENGAYSDEQLSYLKQHVNTDTYNAAAEHNVALSSPDGYVKVSQSVQAQDVPWYSPQNLIASNVGNPMALDERFYKPGDLVGVKTGSGIEYVVAKDLPGLRDQQAFGLYGTKALVLSMDVAMLAMGAVEIGAVVAGAEALGTAGATMTMGRLAMTAGKGVLDFGLGASEPIGNAYWTSADGGQAASIRGYAFLATIGYGMAAQGIARVSTGFAAKEAASAAEVSSLVDKTPEALKVADRMSKAVMAWGQLPMVGQISLNVVDQLSHFTVNEASADVAADAASSYRGVGDQAPRSDYQKGTELVQTTDQVAKSLGDYKSDLMQNAANSASAQKVGALFDQAGQLESAGSDAQKQAFLQTLAKNIEFSGTDISRLEQMNGGKLNEDQIKQLMRAKIIPMRT